MNIELTPRRKQRSIDDKYEIIMFYLSIESKGRGAKEETRRKFNLASISSLNTILSQKDEIIRSHESNQTSSKRVRLTCGRLPSLEDQLYEEFVELRSRKNVVGCNDLIEKASEIKEKLLANSNLTLVEKEKLEKFKASSGFIRAFNSRHNINFKNLSNEAASVDMNVVNTKEENDEEGSPKTIELKDKYKDLNVILGEGSYGVVFKAESIQQKNKLYAIKKLKMPFNSEMRNEFLKCPEYTESKLIFSLATSNEISRFAVISEECFFDRANYLYYASEFSEEGNLRNRIDNNRKLGKQFPEEQIAEWSKEIICGLEFLHRNGIIHRNIKPSNILLKEDHLKLCDLGEAKNFIDSILDTVRVSVSYWSPELILFEEMPGIQITNKTDIWSAGVVIYELITLDFPFKSVPIRYSIKNNKVPELQKDKPKHFQILINMMLHKEPTIRADSSELKAVFDYLKFISNFV